MQKKYSINWKNDEPVSFEVDGVSYESLDQIPDEDDREKLTAMMDASWDQQFEKEFQDFDKEFKKDWEENKKSSINVEKLILGVFTGVAVLMLGIAAISAWSAVSKMSKEQSAPGRVVDMVVQREYINEQDRVTRDYYYPVVEFTSRDGRRHSTRMSEGSQSQFYEVGDEVTVRYNPDHPLDARIKSAGSDALMWILPGITGVLGLGFLGAVLAVHKFMPPEEVQNELA
jgi:hypothetical protein